MDIDNFFVNDSKAHNFENPRGNIALDKVILLKNCNDEKYFYQSVTL